MIGALDVMSSLFLAVSKPWLPGVPETGRTCSFPVSAQPVQGLGRLCTQLRCEKRVGSPEAPSGLWHPIPTCGLGAALSPAPLPPLSSALGKSPFGSASAGLLEEDEVEGPSSLGKRAVCVSFSGSWMEGGDARGSGSLARTETQGCLGGRTSIFLRGSRV